MSDDQRGNPEPTWVRPFADPVHVAKVQARPSFTHLYLELAAGLALRSTCRRLGVGCVIASEDSRYVYGLGYNGNATGLPNDCDSVVPGGCGCLHAEENAVINCTAPRYAPKVVYCTHLPCVACAKRLINLGGVLRVVYLHDYRIKDALDVLERAGITAWHHALEAP